MSDPEVGEAPGRDMSDPDVSEAPEPASEDKEQRRRRKKERKRRTPEEKEERRRRKEAAANAAANVDANARADDSAAEVDADADGAISGNTPAGSPSVKFSASSRKSPDVDVEKGAVVDEKLKIPYDGPTFVPPSKSAALQHARETNVLRRRAGISVYLEDECLEDMDGDEILTEIYPQCERRGIAVTKVVKTSKRAATVEDVLFSQASDLEAMGLTVGGKKLACVAETLPEPEEGEEGERPAGADGLPDLSHPYVLSKTGVTELGELGVGIGLYFHSLLWGAKWMAILTVVGAFTTITYVMAGTSSTQLKREALTGFAIPTLGAVAFAGENEKSLLFGSGSDKIVMAAISAVECAIALGFIFLVRRMKRDQTKTIEAIDVSNISLQDYAVKVDYLPKKDLTPEEIGKFFSKFGRVHMVVLGTDVGALIGKHKARADLAAKLEFVVAGVARAKGQNVVLNELLANARLSMEKLEKKLAVAQKADAGRPTSAFVVFETEEGRVHCERKLQPDNVVAWLFRRKKYRFRGTHRMWVHRAPEASDILWENLGVTGLAAKARKALAWVCMILVLVCTCALVVLAEAAKSTNPPAITCEAPATAGTLKCDDIWPASTTSGDASKTILAEMSAFQKQVDAVTCAEYVSGGEWKGDASKFAPYDAVGADTLYDAGGAWSGGFDSTTDEDECAAMACFDCFCKTRVLGLIPNALGMKGDADGYWLLCEDYFAAQGLGLATSGFTAVLNVILGTLTRVFSNFECHHTKSGLESSVSVKLFLALIINSALIPVLVFSNIPKLNFLPYLFQGPYKDFEVDWYQVVSSTLSITLVVNALAFPVKSLVTSQLRRLSRWAFASSAITQRQLNAMYEGEEFDLSERYAQVLSMIFVALAFQSTMPLLMPATALFCFSVYHEAKYTLLRHSKRPPEYDETMAKFFWAFAPSAAFVKLLVSLWALTYASVPSFTYSFPALESLVSPISEEGKQFDFAARLLRVNGAAPFFTVVAIIVGAFVNTNRAAFSAVLRKIWPNNKVFDEDELAYVPDLSIALSDGILKGLTTYMISANPEYNEIVPATATVGAGGSAGPTPKTWEEVLEGMSKEEEARMKREMEKMTATFTPEEAGEYSAEMSAMLGKKERKRRSKKKKNDDDEGEGEDLWGGDRAFSRKSSTVQPLGGWVDGLGASFNVDPATPRGFESVEATNGLSAAMATQPEGDPEEVKETREEKEARRQRRREKREKRESRRREREEAD